MAKDLNDPIIYLQSNKDGQKVRLGEQQKKILIVLLSRHRGFDVMTDEERKYKHDSYWTNEILKPFFKDTAYFKRMLRWEERSGYRGSHKMRFALSARVSTVNSLHALEKSGLVKRYGGTKWIYKKSKKLSHYDARGEGYRWSLTPEGQEKAEEILEKADQYVREWGHLCEMIHAVGSPTPLTHMEEMFLMIMLNELDWNRPETELYKITDIGMNDFFWTYTTTRNISERLWKRGLVERINDDGSNRAYHNPTLKLTDVGREEGERLNKIIRKKLIEIQKEDKLLSKYFVP